jgi:hypothetical protein
MSDITNEKPHHRYGNGYNVSFWRGNTASNEESATRAIVYTGAPGMPYPDVKFSLPDERRKMEDLEQMLQNSFAAGDAHARHEIRRALGITTR